jgi:hypothetical protein
VAAQDQDLFGAFVVGCVPHRVGDLEDVRCDRDIAVDVERSLDRVESLDCRGGDKLDVRVDDGGATPERVLEARCDEDRVLGVERAGFVWATGRPRTIALVDEAPDLLVDVVHLRHRTRRAAGRTPVMWPRQLPIGPRRVTDDRATSGPIVVREPPSIGSAP